jgi:hypothetical protein
VKGRRGEGKEGEEGKGKGNEEEEGEVSVLGTSAPPPLIFWLRH